MQDLWEHRRSSTSHLTAHISHLTAHRSPVLCSAIGTSPTNEHRAHRNKYSSIFTAALQWQGVSGTGWMLLCCRPFPAPAGAAGRGARSSPAQPSTAQFSTSSAPAWGQAGPAPGLRAHGPAPLPVSSGALALPFLPSFLGSGNSFPFLLCSSHSVSLQAPNLGACHVWEFTQVKGNVSAGGCLWFIKVMFRGFYFLENQPLLKCCEMFSHLFVPPNFMCCLCCNMSLFSYK